MYGILRRTMLVTSQQAYTGLSRRYTMKSLYYYYYYYYFLVSLFASKCVQTRHYESSFNCISCFFRVCDAV